MDRLVYRDKLPGGAEAARQPNRRSFLTSTAGAFSALLLSRSELPADTVGSASCSLDRELTQGPYYLDRGILRRDITEKHPGVPLQLRLTVIDARTCAPISNAALEIWHCDAKGIYSGFTAMSPDSMGGPPGGGRTPGGRPPGPPPGSDFDAHSDDLGPDEMTEDPGMRQPPPGAPGMHRKPDDTTFCRGVQLSNATGLVEFETIYPGWYVGRDTHIHLKVHIGGNAAAGPMYVGGHVSHTGQLFFPDELSDEIARAKPYRDHGASRTRLDEDGIYAEAHSTSILLSLSSVKSNSVEAGFIGNATLRVDPTALSHERGPGGFGRAPGPNGDRHPFDPTR